VPGRDARNQGPRLTTPEGHAGTILYGSGRTTRHCELARLHEPHPAEFGPFQVTNVFDKWTRYEETLQLADSSLPTALRGLAVTQVAFLVADLAAGVETWSSALGKSDWLIYTYGPDTVPNQTFRGEPGNFKMRLALSGTSPQLELIEPLEGPSIYHEWLEDHGFGAHHLGFHVPHLEPIATTLAAEGFSPVQAGSGYGVDGDGAFAYYDLIDALGLYVEIIEAPGRRRPSESL